MYNAYNNYNKIWDTQNLYQENLYIFSPIMTKTLYSAYNNQGKLV